MRIFLIGSGGREHAFAKLFLKSPSVSKIYMAPGNCGIAKNSKIEIIPIDIGNLEQLISTIRSKDPDLVVVGPEKQLEMGIVDELIDLGINVFGPTKAAAQLETSKSFAKKFMIDHKIPTAKALSFSDFETARTYLQNRDWSSRGVAIKVDGLAAGKGVVMAHDAAAAIKAAYDFLDNEESPIKTSLLLIEEELIGSELSAFAICDGNSFATLGFAKDHKRVFDNDEGPNTGGMGTISLSGTPNEKLVKFIEERIFLPVINGMREAETPFVGFLFAGLMVDPKNPDEANVIEFNVRMGDPETQVLLPRFDGDLATLLFTAAQGQMKRGSWKMKDLHAIHVVMASGGYPSNQLFLNQKIEIGELRKETDLYFAAVSQDTSGDLVNAGGRVLGVTALHSDYDEARRIVYEEIEKITFSGAHWRRDIGKKTY